MKTIIKRVLVVILCGLLFFGVSYAYLRFNFDRQVTDAGNKEDKVPYKILPENSGIALVFGNNSAVMIYLDFEKNCIKLIDIPEFDSENNMYSGYKVDYTVWTNDTLVEGMIDRIGGVNLKYNGKELRYTGNQVVELISQGCDDQLKRQLFLEIFNQIAKKDFSRSDFVYIIENSKSNLSIVDCFAWIDYISDMSKNISFAN